MHKLSSIENSALLVARFMFVFVFAFQDALYNKIYYASRSIELMTQFNLPYPHVLLILTVAFELLAGFMIIAGWKERWGAFIIFGFTLVATIIFHRFWLYVDPAVFQNQLNHFMKNISIMGGAIYIMVFGAGDYSWSEPKRQEYPFL